ncbi:MAG: hypothetical protein Kow0060_19940 [Methylohalobius crimeensis]
MGETESLRHWMSGQIQAPAFTPVAPLVEKLRELHGAGVAAVLMYGSCLRSGDPFDGLVDLYVLVDDYTSVYERRWQAWANRLLPPNVFYLEIQVEGRPLRVKYAVLSRQDFAAGVSQWFHSYLWGRFAQPCRLLYGRDPDTAEWISERLVEAARTFIRRTVPACSACLTLPELWQKGLRLSYRAELRAENAAARAQQLFDYAADFYQTLTPPLLREFPWTTQCDNGRYCFAIPNATRMIAKAGWALRFLQGKGLSLLRLIKSLFTFQGGVDYIVWKLERHTGRKIEVPPRARRRPLVYGWGVLWRLYREGVFR